MVERVWAREDIYQGEELTNAPDLVLQWKPGYGGDAGLSGSRRLVSPSPPKHSSDHWNESVLLASGVGVRPGEVSATLQDIAPTVLHALGADVPGDLEGGLLPLFEMD